MNIVTHDELNAVLTRLTDTFETGFARIAMSQGQRKQEYFTRPEAAEYLRLGVRTLDNLSVTGELKRAKLGDGLKSSVVYRKRDLDDWVEGRLEMNKFDARRHIEHNLN